MPHRFDAFTRSFATRLSRRTALQATGLGLATGLAGARVAAQNATPLATPAGDEIEDPSFLFVQTATGGTFTANPNAGTPVADGTPTPGGGGDYLLTLHGHHGGTVYFSDRPERQFGDAPTQAFLDGLGFSPTNPPNAALVTQTEDGTEDVAVLELLTPTYDEAAGTLTYGARILSEYEGDGLDHVAAQQQDDALPATFGRSSLFIDSCADVTECLAYGGHTVNEQPVAVNVGGFPGGYRTMCWHLGDFVCHPCNKQYTNADFDAMCNSAYPQCNGACWAD
jgi:hypothetical protein